MDVSSDLNNFKTPRYRLLLQTNLIKNNEIRITLIFQT